ncbi:MAG: type II secretion system F family protein [Candidatus Aenigmarchaeota archaeon]|nr:type II secretion system F family protein [Candidatus Aenigmarchaeota archaeon]
MYKMYKRVSAVFFGGFENAKAFQKMKPGLQAAGINMLLKTYVGLMISTSILVYLATLIAALLAFGIFIPVDTFSFVLFVIAIPIFAGFAAFAGLYFYPSQRASSVKNSIDNDLPFALSHMAAIASSGIPPESLFELLSGFEEYKDISKQASRVVRNIKTFGMSSVSAIRAVAIATPSPTLKQVFNGITFTVEKGGNLPNYLKQMAEKSLFDYRLKREKYLKTLSTYADIYTALVVAAPLMMLAVLGILSVIGGEVIGFTISELITILTFVVLPFMNIAFLAFIHLTYPGV